MSAAAGKTPLEEINAEMAEVFGSPLADQGGGSGRMDAMPSTQAPAAARMPQYSAAAARAVPTASATSSPAASTSPSAHIHLHVHGSPQEIEDFLKRHPDIERAFRA